MFTNEFVLVLYFSRMSNEIYKCTFVGTNELNRSVGIEIDYLESQLALLAKVVDNFEMVSIIWTQVVMNNFCMVNLQPLSLVCVPLHLKDCLCVRFVSTLIKIFEITTLHEYLNDAKLSRRLFLLSRWVFRIFHSLFVL